jgi:hypothetical protein
MRRQEVIVRLLSGEIMVENNVVGRQYKIGSEPVNHRTAQLLIRSHSVVEVDLSREGPLRFYLWPLPEYSTQLRSPHQNHLKN